MSDIPEQPGLPALEEVDKPVARETPKYVLMCGVVLELKPVPDYLLEFALNDDTGRPSPPVVLVKMPNGQTRKESNSFDPKYQRDLQVWETRRNMKMYRLLVSEGIITDPPADWIEGEKLRHYFPGMSVEDMRYMWISKIVDPNELEDLTKAIAGQTVPTQEGLEESERKFRGNSRRKSG